MTVDQTFKQWYAHLYPDDQDILRQYLVGWVNSQFGIDAAALHTLPPAVGAFFHWYFFDLASPGQQASPNQQALWDYLRSWLSPSHLSQRTIPSPLCFSGTPSASVSATTVGKQKNKCPNCHYEF